MIFTSYTYVAFLAVAFVIHWLLPTRARNLALIVLSYVFYCSWKWEYGFLLFGVSLFTFLFGSWLARRPGDGRLLAVAIAIELLPLVYFKYSTFMVVNAADLANVVGVDWHPRLPHIILPLGVSFFTFQGIAYLVDVATGEPPFERLSDFLLFKGFWPQLIAGPIIRPGEIRKQITNSRSLDYPAMSEGLRRILQGFFKKVVLADTIAPFVDSVFLVGARPAAVDCVVGVVGFGLQIYFDFSAYTDIAVGTARLFGFAFPENFDLPYASRSPQEFWNRWHMSLSRWIRDYVFTPLSFSARRHPRLANLWLVVAMAICGLWHGAQWTFVVWGIWHGLLLVFGQTWAKRPSAARSGRREIVYGWAAGVVTFALVTLGWALFRAQSLGQAWQMVETIALARGGMKPAVLRENSVLVIGVIFIGLLMFQSLAKPSAPLVRWVGGDALPWRFLRAGYYAALVVAVIIFDQEARAFVYFQF